MDTTQVTSLTQAQTPRAEISSARVHVWRVLSMLAALVAIVAGLLVVVTSAA